MNDNPNVCADLSHKNKTELRDVCKPLSIPLSGHETKPRLTRKIKEVQAEREPLRQATLDFGRHRGKTYEWVGGADSRGGRCYSVATAEEVRDARVKSSPRRKLHSQITKLEPEEELADLVQRVEHL